MSRMLCKCGATMGTSISPSPYSVSVYYDREVLSAIEDNPRILLSDFLTDWDAVNGAQKSFMKRAEPVEYWYCTECHRVYETQMRSCGHWLRVYRRTESQLLNTEHQQWTRIYVFPERETDVILESEPELLLADYIRMHAQTHYCLSPEERMVVALDGEGNLECLYIQEEAEAAKE
ncbi:MAG: hypothetical protein K6G34_12110 [Lachnospiraceae bacterium]|nr:hypothetical protein [Lachnospiraceae bacterium]